MATIKKFEDIETWICCRELSKKIFKLSSSGKFSKDYKFSDQINNASGSGMDHIAEGFDRGGRNEFENFLSIANGSINEVKPQLYRALDREYISDVEFNELYQPADETSNKTGNLIQYLNRTTISGQKFKVRIN